MLQNAIVPGTSPGASDRATVLTMSLGPSARAIGFETSSGSSAPIAWGEIAFEMSLLGVCDRRIVSE